MQYGVNKEDDKLPQMNLAFVFGESSKLPFYFRKLPGNMPDSKTVMNLLAELDVLRFHKVKLVMDRGSYKEANINRFYKEHVKFFTSKWIYKQKRPYKGDAIVTTLQKHK